MGGFAGSKASGGLRSCSSQEVSGRKGRAFLGVLDFSEPKAIPFLR